MILVQADTANQRSVLVLHKQGHVYRFTVGRGLECRAQLVQTMGRFAANPDLNFEWADAYRMLSVMRQADDQPGKPFEVKL